MSSLMLLSVAWTKAQKVNDQVYGGHRLGEKAATTGYWNQETTRYRWLETGLRGVNVKSCTFEGVGMKAEVGRDMTCKQSFM